MELVDTHCHLHFDNYDADREEVLRASAETGVKRIICVGCGLADSQRAIDFAQAHRGVWATAGAHPHDGADFITDTAAGEKLKSMLAEAKVVAVGEIGLDYHYGLEHKNRQADFFRQQLQIAADFNRPVIIHCREAADDTLAILSEFPSVRCVFHCFTGTADEARRILDRGFFLGFTGPITFKKSDELREVVRMTPIDRLLVETDAPYLSPEPVRKQKINEPALVMHMARTVAAVKQMTLQEVDHHTTANAQRFFGWD